jgi:hypothetical protein
MDLGEDFRNNPRKITMLNKIIDAYDNAVVSNRLDENQNRKSIHL